MNTERENLNLLPKGQKSTNVVKNRKNSIKSDKKVRKKHEGTPEIIAILERMKQKRVECDKKREILGSKVLIATENSRGLDPDKGKLLNEIPKNVTLPKKIGNYFTKCEFD